MTLRDRLRARLARAAMRVRRVERRGVADLRRWAENTENLLHLTVLLALPPLMAAVTWLANLTPWFSFLVFPPLASGAFTLFADPEGEYADPIRFVTGLTGGAAAGWAALSVERLVPFLGNGTQVTPASAGLAVLLAGVVLWLTSADEPSGFSSALLVLAARDAAGPYVLFILLGSTVIASAFVLWRDGVYERRAQYLYGAVRGDDHVLVPIREDDRPAVALGARLAAAHEAGKVVLLDTVENTDVAAAERDALAAEPMTAIDAETGERIETAETTAAKRDIDDATRRAAADAAARLEGVAERVRHEYGVPCEVVVAAGDPAATVTATARAANCDLVVTPFEADEEGVTSFVRSVLARDIDAVALRSATGAESWGRVLVLVARPGDTAHAMIDFAERLGDEIAVCTCISHERKRRAAESKLAALTETTDCEAETRVARSSVDEFVAANAAVYDLVLIGASRERSRASRIVVPPVFERLEEMDPDCDVAVVGRD